jgi:hypothetical protein
MKLKHLIASAALAVASVGASAATLTATLFTSDGVNYSGGFTNTLTNNTGVPVAFTDTITFQPTNVSGTADGFIGTVAFAGVHNIDLTKVTLNGIPFILTSLIVGEQGVLVPANVTGPLILTVQGFNNGVIGTYSGALNLLARVPEPGILALLGIAGLGLALSRRRKEPTLANEQLATA